MSKDKVKTKPGKAPSVPSAPAIGKNVAAEQDAPEAEIGGRDGPDPTRFGDWEKDGRCIDF